MKKILLLTAISSLFFATSAFAHCGSCGTEAEASHDHATKECCGTEGKCCKEKKECKEACEKKCCAKKEAADETAAATKKEGACCPAKA